MTDIRILIPAAITLTGALLLIAHGPAAEPTLPPTPTITHTQELPPCEEEDSDNCYWDADTRGNGEGHSFEVRDGVYTYTS